MHMENRLRMIARLAIGGGLLSFFSLGAHAQNFWVGATSNLWNDATNWSLGAVPNSSSSNPGRAEFTQAGAMNSAIITYDLIGTTNAHSMTFNSDAGAGITINGFSAAQRVSYTGTGLAANGFSGLRFNVLSGDHIIQGGMAGGGNYDIGFSPSGSGVNGHGLYVETGAKLTFNATLGRSVAGSNVIAKYGGGTVVLNGSTSMSSTSYRIDNGILQFGAAGVRGNSANSLTVNSGGTLQLNNVGYAGNNGTLTLNGTGYGSLGALHAMGGVSSSVTSTTNNSEESPVPGMVVVATDSAIGVDVGSLLRFAHGISSAGAGNITKVGDGTLVFEFDNSLPNYGYGGMITVAEGTLLLNSTASSTVVAGTVTVASGSRTVSLMSNDGLTVGQTISGPGIDLGAFITAVSSTSESVTVSHVIDADQSGDYTFGAVTSAFNTSPVVVQSGATFGGVGSVVGSTVTVDVGGTLAPGSSIGTMTTGSADIDGTLEIEFGSNSIDKLTVSGVLDISSTTLDFSAIGSLTNGEYIFAQYDSLVGTSFASVLNLPGSLTINHDTVNKHFSLIGSHSAGVPGDYNNNGVVDSADYVLWRKGGPLLNEVDAPGTVDAQDYVEWRARFGNTSGSGSALGGGAAVPEPAAWLLSIVVVFGASAGAERRCRKSSDMLS